MDMFRFIRGGDNIAKYMGYNRNHMSRDIIPFMESAGLVWRHGNKTNSPLMSTPFLINLYYVLRQQNKHAERNDNE